jgi:hypothetical protein
MLYRPYFQHRYFRKLFDKKLLDKMILNLHHLLPRKFYKETTLPLKAN